MIEPGLRNGEITLKQFCLERAEEDGVTPEAIRQRIKSGWYSDRIRLRRRNRRVIFVALTQVAQ